MINKVIPVHNGLGRGRVWHLSHLYVCRPEREYQNLPGNYGE